MNSIVPPESDGKGTPSPEVVERVAAALWEAQQGVFVTPWDELSSLSPTRDRYRDYARAAIAAMSDA